MNDDDRLLDFDAAMEFLSVEEKVLRALIKPAKPGEKPALRASKLGRQWRFRLGDLKAYTRSLWSNHDAFEDVTP